MTRPPCTCGPGVSRCPAEVWWEQEGRFQVAQELRIRSWDMESPAQCTPYESPHAARFAPAGGRYNPGGRRAVTRDEFERDVRAWITRTGRLPSIVDFDADSGLHHSSRWIYRFYGSLPGFWRHAVDYGWATEAMRLERVRKMTERRQALRSLQQGSPGDTHGSRRRN